MKRNQSVKLKVSLWGVGLALFAGLALFTGCGNDDPVTDPVAVTGVSFSEKTLALVKETTATLVATVAPENATNKALSWSSNSTTVATVSEAGLVTAIAPGTTTITVTTADGGKTDQCVVTVAAEEVSATGVMLDKETLGIVKGDTKPLVATVVPTTATNQEVTWSSNSTTVATVKNGLVTAVDDGTAVITVTADDGEWTASCTVTVYPESRWARSNIVWMTDATLPSGGYLSFAVTSEDNATIPANAQGVFFRWGSLVAISPVGNYDAGRILFSPSGNKSYAWGDIPYVNETTGVLGDYEATADDFATYNNNTGFNASANKGDICRYISAKGWVEGEWRMPTSADFGALAEQGIAVAGGSTWQTVNNVPNEGNNANGFYQPASGYFVGIGATVGDEVTKPANGVIHIPASGTRQLSAGALYQAGERGYIWSGSSAAAQLALTPMFYESGGPFYPETYRTYAMSVRCIREE